MVYKLGEIMEGMRKLFRFRYPKLAILAITIVLSYFIFSNDALAAVIADHGNLGYVGIFVAGALFAFGFTTAFGIGYLLAASPDSIFLAAAAGALGALCSDLLIFKAVRASFMDEFRRIEHTKPIKYMIKEFDLFFHKRVRLYILYGLLGLILASPVPDEVGVLMMSGLTRIKARKLAVISFLVHFLAIWVVLLI